MNLKMNQWIQSVLSSKVRLAIPLMTHPGIELSGKKTIDAVTNGEYHYAAIRAIHDAFHPAVSVANIMMDLTVEAEVFGSKINFAEDEVPSVNGQIVHDKESINKLEIPNLESGRIPEYLRATKLASQKISDAPIFAGCIGPFSLAGRLYGFTEIMTALLIEPEEIIPLLEKCNQFLLDYVVEFKRNGANGIIMAEPAAGLLSAEMCDDFSSKFIKQIVDKVQDDDFLFVLHNCGNTGHVTQSMISTGAKAIHLGNKIDIVKVLREVPSDVLVMGNMDPVGVFKMMKPEEVFEETNKLLEQTTQFRNFIISTGCDTPPGVPIENVKAFFKAVEEYNKIK